MLFFTSVEHLKGRVTAGSVIATSAVVVGSSWAAVIHSQSASVDLLVLEEFQSLNSALNIDEVGMCETSWLSSASINGNSDVEDVANITEKVVQVGVRHLESKVTDKKGLGWILHDPIYVGLELVVDDHLATLIDGVGLGLNGSSSLVDVLELDISETTRKITLALQVSIIVGKSQLTPC